MKKLISLVLSLMMITFVFTGCTKAKDAAMDAVSDAAAAAESADDANIDSSAQNDAQKAPSGEKKDTASEFIGAYMEAKSAVLTRLIDGLTTNQDTMANSLSFLGISMSDLYLLPLLYSGLDESSASTAMAMMGLKDVIYNEQGNTYTITYKNTEDKQASLTGTYDKGRSIMSVGSTNGMDDSYFEAYRTSFGYVSQFYFISDGGIGTVYQVSISGTDGVFGLTTDTGRPAALTGNEAEDFPKAAKDWYAITGNTITGMTSDGKSISFEYVPSENQG